MPYPFNPPAPSRVQLEIDTSTPERVLVDQRVASPPDSLFATKAEHVDSIAPFLRRNRELPLPDPRHYTVLPGGETVYMTEAARDKVMVRLPTPVGLTNADVDAEMRHALDYRRQRPQPTGRFELPAVSPQIKTGR